MPRRYTFNFENVLISAPEDLITIFGASGKSVRILRQWISNTDTTLATSQMFQVRSRYLPATLSNGSGGTVPVGRPVDPGDSAASVTAHANDTSKTTSSGTVAILEENGFHCYQGYDKTFASPPVVGPSEAFVFEILSTPSGTTHFSGGVEVEELAG